MVFFHADTDTSKTLGVSSQWWLYLAVTVPLTIIVFGSWVVWLQWRMRVKREGDVRRNEDEKVEGAQPQAAVLATQ